jgi:4-hydroxybenzoate polyprenyltransferase
MTRLRAWLELSRGANLPTVWSNLLIGWLLAVAFGANLDADSFPRLALLLLGGSLLYTGGMFLNDAADEEWDRARRPERPIPSGRLSPGAARLAGLALLLVGLALWTWLAPLALGVSGLALAALVLAYTRWHKTHPAPSAWLMGACRAVLPLAGWLANPPPAATSLGESLLAAHAVALLLYTVGISALARHESTGGEPTGLARVAPPLAALPIPLALVLHREPPLLAVIFGCGLVLAIGWTRRRIRDIGERVAARIAGLCLVDYLAWVAVRHRFEPADPLSMGGLLLLLFLGTALALRRLMPST